MYMTVGPLTLLLLQIRLKRGLDMQLGRGGGSSRGSLVSGPGGGGASPIIVPSHGGGGGGSYSGQPRQSGMSHRGVEGGYGIGGVYGTNAGGMGSLLGPMRRSTSGRVEVLPPPPLMARSQPLPPPPPMRRALPHHTSINPIAAPVVVAPMQRSMESPAFASSVLSPQTVEAAKASGLNPQVMTGPYGMYDNGAKSCSC